MFYFHFPLSFELPQKCRKAVLQLKTAVNYDARVVIQPALQVQALQSSDYIFVRLNHNRTIAVQVG